MSTKYLNLDVKAMHMPIPDPANPGQMLPDQQRHVVIVALHMINGVPKLKGLPRPRQGQVFSTAYQFESAELAEGMRDLIENLLDFLLPAAVQHGVLVPIDAEEQAKTLILPGGGG